MEVQRVVSIQTPFEKVSFMNHTVMELWNKGNQELERRGTPQILVKPSSSNYIDVLGILPDFRIKQKQWNAEKTLVAHTGSIFRCRVFPEQNDFSKQMPGCFGLFWQLY